MSVYLVRHFEIPVDCKRNITVLWLPVCAPSNHRSTEEARMERLSATLCGALHVRAWPGAPTPCLSSFHTTASPAGPSSLCSRGKGCYTELSNSLKVTQGVRGSQTFTLNHCINIWLCSDWQRENIKIIKNKNLRYFFRKLRKALVSHLIITSCRPHLILSITDYSSNQRLVSVCYCRPKGYQPNENN